MNDYCVYHCPTCDRVFATRAKKPACTCGTKIYRLRRGSLELLHAQLTADVAGRVVRETKKLGAMKANEKQRRDLNA